MNRLCALAATRPRNELFDHVKAYRENRLLFHFHDAFENDLLVSGEVAEAAIMDFSVRLRATYRREPNVNKRDEGLRAFLQAMEDPHKIRIAGEPWWQRLSRRLTCK